MSIYLGIDIGTSGTKTLAINDRGKILAHAMATYPCYHPKPLWSEQDPEDWWQATVKTVRAVVIQITYVIQFLAAFSIFAGVIILASSIAGTRYRRIREVVVLKTLGATRRRIATVFSIEFAVLGLVAGVVGISFANVIARVLLKRLTVAYHFQWTWTVGALAGTAALTVATGWLASHRILGRKPLEVLREE